MSRIDLEAGTFISYEGIAVNGHWNPGGTEAEDAQGVISEFRVASADTVLGDLTHQMIVDFDLRTLETLGEDAYGSTGYYPQLAWIALERSGIWSAMSSLNNGDEDIRLHESRDCAGLLLPRGTFTMAAELVAQGQEIDWDNRTDGCGGHNLLFLYAGNVVTKIYPTYETSNSGLLIESFAFDPAKVEQT